MKTELYQKYVELDLRFKELEQQKKNLRDEIVADMRQSKLDKAVTDFGLFTICEGRKSWTYSSAVKALKEKVKLTEIKEQEKGIAKAVLGESYLVFKEKGDEPTV